MDGDDPAEDDQMYACPHCNDGKMYSQNGLRLHKMAISTRSTRSLQHRRRLAARTTRGEQAETAASGEMLLCDFVAGGGQVCNVVDISTASLASTKLMQSQMGSGIARFMINSGPT